MGLGSGDRGLRFAILEAKSSRQFSLRVQCAHPPQSHVSSLSLWIAAAAADRACAAASEMRFLMREAFEHSRAEISLSFCINASFKCTISLSLA
jgi:hypothetical protein